MVFNVFMFLFSGYLAAYTAWFTLLPDAIVKSLFSVQLETIRSINAGVVGLSVGGDFLMQIFSNNIKVMIFCILFSLWKAKKQLVFEETGITLNNIDLYAA